MLSQVYASNASQILAKACIYASNASTYLSRVPPCEYSLCKYMQVIASIQIFWIFFGYLSLLKQHCCFMRFSFKDYENILWFTVLDFMQHMQFVFAVRFGLCSPCGLCIFINCTCLNSLYARPRDSNPGKTYGYSWWMKDIKLPVLISWNTCNLSTLLRSELS